MSDKPLAPPMTPVVSSNIDSIGHDGAALWIKFKHGGVYRYPTAGRDLHDEMLKAPSVGQFFHTSVRGTHQGEKIE
jgi:hypothetical protein